ncbi:MAG: autotransporter outer membrane beta-barrel domain-containing protein, partial [bacterium]|nr:autotransporter outer membrane beta-barrel domain-containing protein [bacterium]
GNVDLGDGNNTVSMGVDADITGNIVFGDDDDRFELADQATDARDLAMGAGSDSVDLLNSGDPDNPGGSTLTGNIDLGVAQDAVDDSNYVVLRAGSFLDGDVSGGIGQDQVYALDDATVDGNIDLGAGDNFVLVGPDAQVTGTIDFGGGEDTLELDEGSQLDGAVDMGAGADTMDLASGTTSTATIDFGAGDDTVSLATGATLTGSLDLGPDADTVSMHFDSSVTGTIDLGAGDDVFQLEPGADFPDNLVAGLGSDTLQLDALTSGSQTGVADLTDIQTTMGADPFEALVIGPDSGGDAAFDWLISTTAPTAFADGVELQSGEVEFDGTVELTGDLVQRRGSVMVFDLGVGTEDSMLLLDGELTIETSLVDVHSEARITINRNISEGEFTLIETTGGIVDEDDNAVTEFASFSFPSIAVFSIDHGVVGDDYILTVTRASTYDDFGRNANEETLGRYLDKARRKAGASAFADVAAALDLLSVGELETGLSQLGPEGYDAHTSSVLAWGREQQRVLQERPMRCDRYNYAPRPEVVSTSPCGARGIMPWAKAVGTFGHHKGSASSGYDVLGGGVLMGLDHRVSDRYWWSADVGFGHIEVEHDNGAEGDFESIDLGAAAGVALGAFSARSSLTYSHGFHEMDRKVDFLGDHATSKFDSDRVTIAAGAGYRVRFGPLVIEPNATVDFTHVEEEAVDESGLGAASLDLDSRKSDVFAATGGITLSTNVLKYRYVGEWLEWADGLWTPTASVHWRQAVGDVDRDLGAQMQGAPNLAGDFEAEAEDSSGGLEIGVGIGFQPLASGVAVEIGYDLYLGDDVTTHNANASVRIPF